MVRGVRLLAGIVAALGVQTAHAAGPQVAFRVFVNTGHDMASIVWTGQEFLYVENTKNTIWAAPPSGQPLRQFAAMPELVEETRCVLSPGRHGFPPGVIFCHSPDDKIYEIGADGSQLSVFATLPSQPSTVSDGALAVDDSGRFGYQLVAATGRSGAGQPLGGAVYTVSAAGVVTEVGTYSGPGADEVLVAPSGFGSVAGDALLTLDGGSSRGALVAMDPNGRTRTLATLPAGLNPIAPIPAAPSGNPTQPAAGLYVTNDENFYVYFAPAAQLAAYAGDVIVGAENTAQFWILVPRGHGFGVLAVRHNLRGRNYSLEGAISIG